MSKTCIVYRLGMASKYAPGRRALYGPVSSNYFLRRNRSRLAGSVGKDTLSPYSQDHARRWEGFAQTAGAGTSMIRRSRRRRHRIEIAPGNAHNYSLPRRLCRDARGMAGFLHGVSFLIRDGKGSSLKRAPARCKPRSLLKQCQTVCSRKRLHHCPVLRPNCHLGKNATARCKSASNSLRTQRAFAVKSRKLFWNRHARPY
jgi:hypothetical protein